MNKPGMDTPTTAPPIPPRTHGQYIVTFTRNADGIQASYHMKHGSPRRVLGDYSTVDDAMSWARARIEMDKNAIEDSEDEE